MVPMRLMVSISLMQSVSKITVLMMSSRFVRMGTMCSVDVTVI